MAPFLFAELLGHYRLVLEGLGLRQPACLRLVLEGLGSWGPGVLGS